MFLFQLSIRIDVEIHVPGVLYLLLIPVQMQIHVLVQNRMYFYHLITNTGHQKIRMIQKT